MSMAKKRISLKKLRAKNARRLTPALVYVAATKARKPGIRGTFGPASEVRHVTQGAAIDGD